MGSRCIQFGRTELNVRQAPVAGKRTAPRYNVPSGLLTVLRRRFPQFDWIAFRIMDPAEPADL